MKQLRVVWIVAAAIFLTGAGRAPIYLGVLEPPIHETPMSETYGHFHLRVAFRFADRQWSAMPPAAGAQSETKLRLASWTIALHGKKLGQVSSAWPPDYAGLSTAGLTDLSAESNPPRVQDDAAMFATWMGVSHYRPLLAVSEPHYDDPDNWTAFDAAAAIRRQAVAAFRRAITPDDADCHGGDPSGYPDSAIQVFGKPYRSKDGDVLIAMRPDPRRNRCDGPVGDEWQSVWFHLKGGNIRRIGSALTLLDIGDYDGDGTAKILFQYDGYDRDGYLLFDPRDDSKTEFSWVYH
jgi:hypothetical protein